MWGKKKEKVWYALGAIIPRCLRILFQVFSTLLFSGCIKSSRISSSFRTYGMVHNWCHFAQVPPYIFLEYARIIVFTVGLRTNPLGGLLHFSPLRTYSREHQAHASRALAVLSLLILVSVLALGVGVSTARSEQSINHKGFACCVRGTFFSVIGVHRRS